MKPATKGDRQMPQCYIDTIREIDASVDVELVGDIADEMFRFFSSMSRDEWAECVAIAKEIAE